MQILWDLWIFDTYFHLKVCLFTLCKYNSAILISSLYLTLHLPLQTEYLQVEQVCTTFVLGFVILLALLKIENAFNLFSRRQQGRPHPSKSIEQRRCGGCPCEIARAMSAPQTQDRLRVQRESGQREGGRGAAGLGRRLSDVSWQLCEMLASFHIVVIAFLSLNQC